MARINVLGFDVANLIAAGEVVDRPSSVVKELIENSIDAGATSLTVEVKNGGKTFIRITDNGCGIEFDDLPTAILRHATSKIKDATDLDSIMTLGFRGEALSAISSVAKVRIMSKTSDCELGGFLECHAGEVLSHIKTSCSEGTTIIVEELFYNVPARKKFLKSDKAEAGTVSAVVEKVALSRPDIAFRYILDSEVKFVTRGDGNLQNAIYAVLGKEIAKRLIKVSRRENGISVEGYISTPEINRANRNLENFYINSRFVKSKTMGSALEQAYQSYIPSDKFPFCVLNLEIDPTLVDVNVHPAKLEVKFSNESVIFTAVYYAVRTALAGNVVRPELYEGAQGSATPISSTQFPVADRNAPAPEAVKFDSNSNIGIFRQRGAGLDYTGFDPQKGYGESKPLEINNDKAQGEKPQSADTSRLAFAYDESEQAGSGATEQINGQCAPSDLQNSIVSNTPAQNTYSADSDISNIARSDASDSTEADGEGVPQAQSFITEDERRIIVPDYKIIGEAFNSYVIVELGDTMYLIDKHAAHERIIFEDLKKKIKGASPSSQLLMIPIEVYLTSDELGALDEWQDDIKKVGFSVEVNGSRASITEIPSEIEQNSAKDTLVTLLSRLASGEGDAQSARYEVFERALYQASCKSAIKAGRIYDEGHIKWICDRVLTLDNIKYCPHGRPVALEMTKHFLERQFERIK
ncbi:MAG: DNA mismatch repair endonuclease MutL [Clostridia bacterium]|nr:DNA mismatch repair endonuclease MutL [Clostridia bacterium]